MMKLDVQTLVSDLNATLDWTDVWSYHWLLETINASTWLIKQQYNRVTGQYDVILYRFEVSTSHDLPIDRTSQLSDQEFEILNHYVAKQRG